MGTIATGLQTRQKDCYATSERVRLTLRTNGEEVNSIITPQGTLVQAGFEAPTVTPTGSVGAGGTLSGYYVYFYVYASTKYPYVENAVATANGELWPRSNPSPASAVQNASAGSKAVTLTVTQTTRTDVDRILIYRTQSQSTSAAAQALADAGTAYYVGQLVNYGTGATSTFTDTGLTDTGEAMELDNYIAPACEFCVFDGTYWWACGSPLFTADVTLDGSSTVTIAETSDAKWFSGRNGQICDFSGISSGGFDGIGNFYFGATTDTTGTLYADADLTIPLAAGFAGTTTIYIQGLTSILYRSKPLNPFSWGITENIVTDNVVVPTPETFTVNMGGGAATALAISPNGKRLKVDFENPQRTIAYDLEQADSDGFAQTQVILDNTASCTCHFAQFNGFYQSKPVLFGLDTYNGEILVSDGYSQQAIDDPLGVFLQGLPKTLRATKFIHGQYDPGTQLACFWMRLYDTVQHNNILVWYHDPSQQWGWMPDFDVLCSATLLDSQTGERFLIGGSELGFMGQLLAPAFNGQISNWMFDKSNTTLFGVTGGTGLLTGSATTCTATSPSTGVFLSGEPSWVVGQRMAGALGSLGRVVSVEQVSTTVWQTTLDQAYTEDAPGSVDVTFDPSYYGRALAVFTNGTSNVSDNPPTDFWYTKLVTTYLGGFASSYALEYYFNYNDTTLVTDFSTIPYPDASRAMMGGSVIALRSYFDLTTPTVSKRPFEAWLTGNPYVDGYTFVGYSGVFYSLFSEEKYAEFPMIRDVPAGNTTSDTPSLAFFCKNEVPSQLTYNFGFEIICGTYLDNEIFNYTIKVEPAS